MRFLTISSLPELQARTSPQTLLGEWCLSEDRLYEENLELLGIEVLPYPWDDPSRRKAAFADSETLYHQFLEQFAQALNKFHSVDYPVRYWRILLGPWLSSEIDILVDRLACLTDAQKKWGDITVVGPRFHQEPWLQDFSFDQIRKFYGKVYQAKLVGQLAEKLMIPVDHRQVDYLDLLAAKQPMFKPYYTRVMRRLAQNLIRIPGARLIGAGLSRKDKVQFALQSGLVIQSYSQMPFISPSRPRHDEARAWLSREISVKSELGGMFASILTNDLPSAYFEGHSELVARNFVPSKRPCTWLGGTAWFGDEGFKINSAQGLLRGDKVFGMQHGGYYGTARHHFFEDHERACADRYLTWGWKSRPSDLPYHSIHLSRTSETLKRNRKRKLKAHSTPRILYVSTSHYRETLRFQSHPLGPQWRRYFEDQFTFFSSLSNELLKNISLRLYPTEFGWDLKSQFKSRFPLLKIDTNATSLAALSECDLLIVDHPATTFLEAMACDIPTLAFWRKTEFEVRPSAQEAFEKLFRAGIVYESPEAAAECLPDLVNDCQAWWTSPTREAAREEFRDLFCKTDSQWRARLKELVRDSSISELQSQQFGFTESPSNGI